MILNFSEVLCLGKDFKALAKKNQLSGRNGFSMHRSWFKSFSKKAGSTLDKSSRPSAKYV
jgi:hypothetical protein